VRYIFVVVLVTLTLLRNKEHCVTLCYVWSLRETFYIRILCGQLVLDGRFDAVTVCGKSSRADW